MRRRVARGARGFGRALGWVTVRPVNWLVVRPVRWVGARGLDFVTRHGTLLVWLATAIMMAIAWPTVGLTHEVPDSLWPMVAALGVLPLLWLRVAPFLGWVTWVIPAAIIPLVFPPRPPGTGPTVESVSPDLGVPQANDVSTTAGGFPWQISSFIVLLALLIAVGVTETPERVGLTFLGTAFLFLAHLPSGMTPGWVFGAAAFLGLGLLLRGLFRSRREAAEQARRAEEQTRRAELEQARAVLAEERTRIARDLHDVVAHRMSMVVVQAQSAQYRLGGVTPEVAAEFESVAGQAREALNEVRAMLGVLRSEDHAPEQAPQPGTEDVLRLLRSTSEAGVDLTWSVTGETEPGSATAMVLFRVLQESLANASRHAPGAWVRVDLDYGAEVRVRIVSGPGHGHPRDTSGSGGHGIPGMSARAASVSGRLSAGPASDGSWVVSAVLPSRAVG
ncbi:histidine kinase [Ornithinimicrobium sp. F0845]|uniref:sensor histidine kinase n=1 Tax=Ornithinimicrobium sp. F0845 TaxID=2926412 RepID=UPI001FF15263|nr:histidine kinase [Ornithinimicrobium sp. F0845]MCK0114142.1 histidine kinase [Ornithinimicrobium sp. F0845]